MTEFDKDADIRWGIWMTAAREAAGVARKGLEQTSKPQDSIEYQNTLLMIEILDRMGTDRNYHAAVTSANAMIDTLLRLTSEMIQQEQALLNLPVTGKPS